MKVGEIFMSLGFDVDDRKLDNFDDKIKSLTANMARLALGAVAAVYAVDRFVQSSIRGAAALRNFNIQTGLSADELQRWQAAGTLSNIALSADDVTASIIALTQNLAQIRLGGGNVAPFQLLGIDIANQDAFSVLKQVRESIQGLDRPTAVNLLQQMGINPGMLNTLLLSQERFDELAESMTRTRATTAALEKLGDVNAKFHRSLSLLKDELVAKYTPAIIRLFDAVTLLAGAIANVVMDVYGLASSLGDAGEAWKLFAIGVGVAMAALMPLRTTLAAIFLLLDDIATYKRGGKSLIGDALNGGVISQINDIIDNQLVAPLKVITGQNRGGGAGASNIPLPQEPFPPSEAAYWGVNPQHVKKGTRLRGAEDSFIGMLSRGLDALKTGRVTPIEEYQRMNKAQERRENNVTFNNRINIHSNESPGEIARRTVSEMQNQLDYGLSDQNNGAVR